MPPIAPAPFRLFANPRAARAAPYRAHAIQSLAAFADAKREIASWPGYRATPLVRLTPLAAASDVAEILYKDEAPRFGLGSFKALGGAYAVFRLLRQAGVPAGRVTVTCATDGNHGRSVAWGAHTFGCRCVIYVHAGVSEARCHAIRRYGAEVRRVAGTYDDAVRRAASDAATQGWHVVSDTSYEGYLEVPRDVMQGYALMADEALEQAGAAPSHVFVQGGVGGLAAAICAYYWERLGAVRPRLIVVEPDTADCIYRSAAAGRPTPAEGALDTIMAGLACGEVSLLAWQILERGGDAFMTIGDDAAMAAMRLLAAGDPPLVGGESGVAGLAGLLAAAHDASARTALGLDARSTVLVFGTEGATDPEIYRRIVGRSAAEVAA